VGLFLAAVAAFAALMGAGAASFAALGIAWVFVPAPFVYGYLLLRPPSKAWHRRGATGYFVASAVLTAALLFGVAWIGSERALHPNTCEELPELPGYPALERAVESVSFVSADGTRLAGWLATGSRPEAVVVLHGYRCDRREVLPHADMLYGAGFTVLMFDFRNRGESGGDFVSLGFFERDDAQAAIDYLKSRADVGTDGIGLLGISQGAATAILTAAASDDVDAVVAEASFRSLDSAIAQSFTHFIGLPAFPFAPITVWLAEQKAGIDSGDIVPERIVGDISPRPLLVAHGLDDDTISPADSEAIFAAAGEPKELWLIPGADHAKGATAVPDEYRDRIVKFFDENL
jgi:fermentation-respiration switch protein FrsA (DUF1100 family)